MTAIALLLLLTAGAVGYVSWADYRIAHGDPAWWFVAGAPLAYLLPVFVLASLWFTLSWIWRTPRPPEYRLGPAASARLFLAEVGAVALSWPLMIAHRLLMRDPAPAPAPLPLLLVHGVAVNDGVWFAVRRDLVRRGLGPVYTINYGPPLAGIEYFAGQLASRIDAICAATGAERVALIAHSMGGLVARAYLRRFGAARIAQLITIGTPHHGSILAWTFFGRCLAQMRPGNPWLADINRAESAPATVPITSIRSRHDSMVAPQASAELACARNVALAGIGHNALLNSRDAMDEIARAIANGKKAAATETAAGAAR
ncbi:MAG TPA: alpha/beta fold hydrolase [Casimicrobiaceae bacterium]|jgi:triacylglycerol esterase/lipase EstA (alpha/beta hydrolase family)|nr:alpha/beta fold hydrolase [Casimicrobiaceae bacterium]